MTSPVVQTTFTPEGGRLLPSQPIKLRIGLDTGAAPPPTIIQVRFLGDPTEEVIWDGSAFTASYVGSSSVETVVDGGDTFVEFYLIRTGGWLLKPTFSIIPSGSGDGGGGVPNTREVNTTAPVTGGGALSADLTLGLDYGQGLGLDGADALELQFPGQAEGDQIVNIAGVWELVPAGATGKIWKMGNDYPGWEDETPGAITLQTTAPIAGGSGVPGSAFTLSFAVASEANGDILARIGGAWTRLAAGTNTHVLTMVAGAPAWAAASGGGVPTSRTLQGTSPIAIGGAYTPQDLTADRVITFAIASEAQGDLVYRGASAWTRLGAGTAGNVLKTGGAGADPAWGTLSAADVGAVPTTRTLQGTSPIAIGGGYSAVDLSANRTLSLAIAGEANGDLMVRAGGVWTRLAVGTNTHVLTVTGGAPAWAAPAASSITIASTTLSGGGTGSSFTLNVLYGTTANTALQGTNDALYVKLAGAQNITGAKTFDTTVTLGVSSDLRVDTGGGIIIAYRLSGGVHEFGTSSANVLVNGLTATEIKTGTSVRYVQSATTHSWYSATALKMTLGSGLHVGTTAVSRSNGEFSAATAIIQGTGARDASAVLDLQSTALGALLPRLDTTARNAIASPATSLLIYNTTNTRHEWWDGAAWQPLGSGALPFYLAGAAGSGPGGSSPRYATLTAMMNAMVADGASSASPRVGFFVGSITENPTLRDGCYIAGLSDSRSAAGHTIVGRVDFQPSAGSAAGLANCTIDNSGAAGIEAFLFRPTAGSSILLVNVHGYGGTGAGTPTFDLDGSVDPDDSIVEMENCTGQGVWGVRVEKMEVRISGAFKANASAGESARSIRGTDAAIIQFERAPIARDRGAAYTNMAIADLQGSVELDDGSQLYLGVGVNVAGSSDYTVGPVYSETPLFKLSDGSSLQLAGGHHFKMDDESDYLFGTDDTGSVFAAGDYRLDESVYPNAEYWTQAGITVNNIQCLVPERVQLITTTATIARRTTLAIIIPAAGTTFTVTMPAPAGFGTERKLRVKYTGGTNKQDLTLAAATTLDIDYDAAKDSITLKWNDGYHFAAYDSKWIILSRTSSSGTSGGSTYTYVPIFKGYAVALGASAVLAGGGLFKTAEHDITGGRTIKLRAVMYCDDATVDATFTLYDASATPIASLNTSALVTTELTSADLSSSFGSDVVLHAYLVDANNTVFNAFVLSAELIIGP